MTELQKDQSKWIRSRSNEEVAMALDEASYQRDLELEDIMWTSWLWSGSSRDDPHPMQGWVYAESVAEVLIYGITREEAFIQHLANLGLCRPRSEWLEPGEHKGWYQRVGRERGNQIHEEFTKGFNAFRAIPAAAAALTRTRRQTGWVERSPNAGRGWRLTAEGVAHIDGILDQVVSLETDDD